MGLGILGLILLAGGGLYALNEYRMSRPGPIWVPLALKADIAQEEQEKIAEQITKSLNEEETLRKIVIDADLQTGFGSATEDAAVEELRKRMFVSTGTADTPMGKVPAINVGVDGTKGESEVLERAATRMIKDVWRMMGIDPDTGKPLQRPSNIPSLK